MVRLSIIVPIYNKGKYLERCVQSIQAQSLRDIEIILVDDASSDESPALIAKFAAADKRVISIKNEYNRGPFYSRCLGVAKSSGSYLGFVDADDFIEPNMYQLLYDTAVEGAYEIVQCAVNLITGTKTRALGLQYNKIYKECFGADIWLYFMQDKILGILCNKICTRKLWERSFVDLADLHLAQDEDGLQSFYLSANAQSFYSINDRLYNYLQYPDSSYNNTSPANIAKKIHDYNHIAALMLAYAQQNFSANTAELAQELIRKRIVSLYKRIVPYLAEELYSKDELVQVGLTRLVEQGLFRELKLAVEQYQPADAASRVGLIAKLFDDMPKKYKLLAIFRLLRRIFLGS